MSKPKFSQAANHSQGNEGFSLGPPGIIEANTAYTLTEFEARTGMGPWARRQAFKSGLKIRRRHGKVYILGRDWIAYLQDSPT